MRVAGVAPRLFTRLWGMRWKIFGQSTEIYTLTEFLSDLVELLSLLQAGIQKP